MESHVNENEKKKSSNFFLKKLKQKIGLEIWWIATFHGF